MTSAAKTKGNVVDDIPERADIREEASALYLRGVERLAAVQKQLIDVVVQHNKEAFEVIKRATAKIPGAVGAPALDLAHRAVGRSADIHKSAVDLVVEQNKIWMDTFTDRTGTVKKSSESATNAFKHAMESTLAVQRKALEHTASQTKAMVDAARNQFGFSGTQADAMTDTFRRGVDTIVEAQKELLNIAIH